MLMNKYRIIAFATVLFWALGIQSFGQCSSCDITISTTNCGYYSVETGTKLCITSSGKVYGIIVLNGGTICNEGVFSPSSFSMISGTFNNFHEFYYDHSLLNNGTFNNLGSAKVRLSGSLTVGKFARYLSHPAAQLLVNVNVNIVPSGCLIVNAGADQTIFAGSVILGGNPAASSGTAPYTYSWTPATGVSCTSCPNPTATPSVTTAYTLTVTDAVGYSTSDVISIVMIEQVPSYGLLKKKLDGGYYQAKNNKVYFAYEEEYNNGALDYKLFDNNRVQIPTGFNLTRNYGDNRYLLDFTSSPLVSGQYYTLEVTSAKNEIYQLKFKY